MKQAITALIKARKAMGPAVKSSINPHFKSRYVDLQGVYDACLDALLDNGLVPVQGSRAGDAGGPPHLETSLLHESGEVIGPFWYPLCPAKANDPQSLGAAMTYSRRYSLMAILSLAPEDLDGETASRPVQQAPEPKVEAPKPTPKAVSSAASSPSSAGAAKATSTSNAAPATEPLIGAADAMAIFAKLGKSQEEAGKWASQVLDRPVAKLREARASEVSKLKTAAGVK